MKRNTTITKWAKDINKCLVKEGREYIKEWTQHWCYYGISSKDRKEAHTKPSWLKSEKPGMTVGWPWGAMQGAGALWVSVWFSRATCGKFSLLQNWAWTHHGTRQSCCETFTKTVFEMWMHRKHLCTNTYRLCDLTGQNFEATKTDGHIKEHSWNYYANKNNHPRTNRKVICAQYWVGAWATVTGITPYDTLEETNNRDRIHWLLEVIGYAHMKNMGLQSVKLFFRVLQWWALSRSTPAALDKVHSDKR